MLVVVYPDLYNVHIKICRDINWKASAWEAIEARLGVKEKLKAVAASTIMCACEP